MKIMDFYGIPISGNGCNLLDIDQDSYTMLQNFLSKHGAGYDLITAAKNGDDEANILLEKLWHNKCYLYWNYKNKCSNPSFLHDFINFQKKHFNDQSERLNYYSQKEKVKNIGDTKYFKELSDLVGLSLIATEREYILSERYVDKLCDFINSGVEEKYKKYNKTNIRKLFQLTKDIANDGIYIYSPEFQKLRNINIVLPVEGLVSGIYLFEVYHQAKALKNIVFESPYKGLGDVRAESVKNMSSTSSSMRAKLERDNVVSLTFDDRKKISKGKKVSMSINILQDLRDYTNYRYKDEETRKITDIQEVIKKLPIELSSYESPIDDNVFKRCVFFRSEIIRHLGFSNTVISGVFKESSAVIFEYMDEVDSAFRYTLKLVLDLNMKHDSVIRRIKRFKTSVGADLPQIKTGSFKRLKKDEKIEDIFFRLRRWIDSQYTVKILNVSREQSDHVRQIKFPEPTDKQKKMFKEALRDYRWLWEFDNSWLDEYLGIDDDERIKLDGKVNRFMKKINNEALVGKVCEPDNIQKILIYQLCASEDSLYFSSDRRYYISGRKKECTLKMILDPKAKQDAKVSIWLNALMRKQFYVNLGYEEVFDIMEDCHNLIAKSYKRMLETGYFCTELFEKYNKDLREFMNIIPLYGV
ncbi:hypothetical protein [uncultured Anaerovibrio sp.]|uniref:hypothetical protein n=1 Tax=uncultured Anaerovibrio sp. TaxID=361586 RepID=UPI0025DCAC5E|nr:hypothetical protein [uncultured Anaerovibrio sp.]